MCDKIIQRGDVFYCNFFPVIGSEQDGLRPAVVLQNNMGNQHSPTTIVAPLTTKKKKHLPTHVTIIHNDLSSPSIVLLEHIRTVDKMRLKDFVCTISEDDMKKIDTAITISLGTGNAYERV